MNIVIPFRRSRNNDEEIRYTLRGLAPIATDVFIVGDYPLWKPKGVNHIPYMQRSNRYSWKERNIHEKIMLACMEIKGNFLLAHDDNFYLVPPSPAHYPHMGRNFKLEGLYGETERNTLERFGPEIKNFDVHCAHPINSSAYINTVAQLDWTIPYGYCIKTAYAVMNGITGDEVTDCKLSAPLQIDRIYGRNWFSADDYVWDDLLPYMRQLYLNKKSRYE